MSRATTVAGIASLGAALAVVSIWVGITIALELIFHFHTVFLGVVAGWTLRAILGPGLSAGRAAWIAGLSFAATIAGQLAIEALGGSLDPLAAVVVIATVGIAAGSVLVARPHRAETLPRSNH